MGGEGEKWTSDFAFGQSRLIQADAWKYGGFIQRDVVNQLTASRSELCLVNLQGRYMRGDSIFDGWWFSVNDYWVLSGKQAFGKPTDVANL